jgi:quinol-cytochrome oxidoreductase complex cytochrome b subunit
MPRAGAGGLVAFVLGALRRPSFVVHLHPPAVRLRTLALRTTYGLGVAALGLGGILAATGILLMLHYVPTAEAAHRSLQDLHAVVPFGGFVRSLHRVAANAMIVVVVLHLWRVLLTGADRFPRTANAWIGSVLLVLTLGLCFTGYLLPWDQRAFWACTVSADLIAAFPGVGPVARRLAVGGDEVGGAALVRFYALHVAALPALGALLSGYHLWRIRKDGGLAVGEGP